MEVRTSKGSINDFAAIIMPFEDENGLYPLCTKRSKSFLSIVNKPILEYQIEYLLNFKFNQIAVVVKKDEYSAFERICTKFVGDANIIYLPFEDFENMNTFEILKKAAETYFNNNFLVLDGNLLTDFDVNLLFEFHILRNSKFTAVFNQPKQENKIKDGSKTNIKCSEIIAVPKYEQEHIVFSKFVDKNAKFEGIDIDKDVIEKHASLSVFSALKNINLYCVSSEFFSSAKTDLNGGKMAKSLIPLFLNLENVDCHLFKITDSEVVCRNIENPQIFKETNFEFSKLARNLKKLPWSLNLDDEYQSEITKSNNSSKFGKDCVFEEPIKMGSNCIFKKCVVGAHCFLGDSVKIINSVIMDHVTIKNNVTIRNSIIQSNASLPEKSVFEGSIVTENAFLGNTKSYKNQHVFDD